MRNFGMAYVKFMGDVAWIVKSNSCICPVIDHNIVKVAVDPRGNSQVDPKTTLTKFIVNNRTDA